MDATNPHDRAVKETLERCWAAARDNPDSAKALADLGVAAAQAGLLDEAVSALEKAIMIDPGASGDHINLGAVFNLQGRFEDARSCFERALALDPERSEAYANLGHVLQELGDFGGAFAACRRALELDADNADAAFNLHALIYDEANPLPALTALEWAHGANPDDERIRFFLAVLCEQAGRPDDAAEYFAALSHGSDGYYYGIDAWAYVKAMRGPNTRLTGPTAQGLQYALAQARVEGLVLEFGVRFGATLNLIAAQAAQTVHGFDSFEGLPENWHGEPAGSYSTGGHKPRVAGNAVLHAGWFKDTLPAFVAAHREPVRFMHIDCDLYSSTATVFRHMGPRVRAGSIIVLDDYFANADWREDEFKAFREAASEYRWTYEYIVFSLYAKQAAVRILSVGT